MPCWLVHLFWLGYYVHTPQLYTWGLLHDPFHKQNYISLHPLPSISLPFHPSTLDSGHIHQPSALISQKIWPFETASERKTTFPYLWSVAPFAPFAPSLLHKRKTLELATKWRPRQVQEEMISVRYDTTPCQNVQCGMHQLANQSGKIKNHCFPGTAFCCRFSHCAPPN